MFAVAWTEHALDDLADVWVTIDPHTRDRIEAAAAWFNAALRVDPTDAGESRNNNRRIAFAGPLMIVFRVDVAASAVRINHTWRRYGR